MIVLSHFQAGILLAGQAEGRSAVEVSTDLELTRREARLGPEGATFSGGERVSWESVREIADSESTCFLLDGGALEKVQFFSETTGRFFSLLPTSRAPTMLIAGFPMHRIKEIDPHEDTLRKIRTIAPVAGPVLDTTTGLGYTAIEAAKTADHVTTIELDPMALEVARCNPWSQALFDHPKIRQVVGDAFEVVPTLESESFSRIFHDPPTFSLAGQLYSEAFYRQLHRVLKRGGRLFHYVGDLDSARGSTVAKGAVRRLQEAGFSRVSRRPEAFGLVGYK